MLEVGAHRWAPPQLQVIPQLVVLSGVLLMHWVVHLS